MRNTLIAVAVLAGAAGVGLVLTSPDAPDRSALAQCLVDCAAQEVTCKLGVISNYPLRVYCEGQPSCGFLAPEGSGALDGQRIKLTADGLDVIIEAAK